ncbi:hypothetical protein U9M48_004294 [Paspalum notatum var. saurae]|uniref:R13L1/DRL21-like LRR repeat region domain-containing protein n=1 Tax=Paspalum notatum var. saurae TaxID=547442 RepID=A0AAQ3SEQ1_PASNO
MQRSMLQTVGDSYYGLHDLIHDLACFLAGEEFYRLDGDPPTEIPQNIRYMSIHKKVTAADISVFPHSLRAVIVIRELGITNETSTLEALFSNCKKLRALDLKYSWSLRIVLPHYMGNMKLLRHFSLRGELLGPDTICADSLVLNGIRNLFNLQALPWISLTGSRCSFNIRDLRNINEVRKLRIAALCNVGHVNYANEAKLQRKRHLRSLHLDFSAVEGRCQCGLQLQPETVRIPHHHLLDSLTPHCSLRELTIQGYDSSMYPRWLGDPSFFKLTTIQLFDLRSKHLPVLAGLPSLKYLTVDGMKSAEDIGNELFRQSARDKFFPSLTELEFMSMSEWPQWSGVGAGEAPCLNNLSLLFCRKLRSLPLGPLRCLVALNLSYCGSIDMFPALPALRELSIHECSTLSEIPSLPSLLKLVISSCQNLRSIGSHTSSPAWQLQCSSSTNFIAVSSPTKLASLDLWEWECPNLRVGNLPSLTTLKLDNLRCTVMVLLASLPLSTWRFGSAQNSPYIFFIRRNSKALVSFKSLVKKKMINLISSCPALASTRHTWTWLWWDADAAAGEARGARRECESAAGKQRSKVAGKRQWQGQQGGQPTKVRGSDQRASEQKAQLQLQKQKAALGHFAASSGQVAGRLGRLLAKRRLHPTRSV